MTALFTWLLRKSSPRSILSSVFYESFVVSSCPTKAKLVPNFPPQTPPVGSPFARPLPADTIENGSHLSSELLGRAQQPVELSTFVLICRTGEAVLNGVL